MLYCASILYGIRIVMHYMAYKTNKKRKKKEENETKQKLTFFKG